MNTDKIRIRKSERTKFVFICLYQRLSVFICGQLSYKINSIVNLNVNRLKAEIVRFLS